MTTFLRDPAKLRATPYTEVGISRVKCVRPNCTRPAFAQWQACADGRQYRAMCEVCDVAVNVMALMFLQPPNWLDNLKQYISERQVDRTDMIKALEGWSPAASLMESLRIAYNDTPGARES